VIRVVAAVILNSRGELLLVRKRETTAFMQPGGKPEDGETAAEALARELREEVGFELDTREFEFIGRYSARAANEPGHTVDADVFFAVAVHDGLAAAEIEELVWVDPWNMDHLELAPLTAEVMRPFILTRAAALLGMQDP
jgi:8-oxo-dGTP pyrophosphatase MutT (NUDIX family)